ncbi:unnamed protein product [Caenorhabditis angaria]|uniref:PAN-3 domain-containing protein n=1 Tax=Caenorhabditis angaria TaxID=860376 RepID=A0A9P1IBN3_9PELO|nr:unnamed protein product [Caenorhabditis angaria]
MLLFLSAFLVIPIIQSVFVLIPGRPTAFIASTILDGTFDNYTNCTETCLGIDDCSAIYYNSTNLTCIRYDYGNLFSVSKIYDYPVTEFFAFKTNTTTCSISPETVYYSRNVSYTDVGTNWEVEGICPTNWLFAQREKYAWCIRLFYEDNLTLDEINKFCADKKNGATISGIGSQRELSYVVQQALDHLSGLTNIYITIDGKLNDSCTILNYGTCKFSTDYTLYDKYIVDSSFYRWKGDNSKSNMKINGSLNRCIRLDANLGSVDHFPCDTGYKLYPCGKLARYL